MQENENPTGGDLLSAWLNDTGRKAVWVAGKLNVDEPAVSRWRNGHYRPTREQADALETLTAGAVPAASW